MDKNQSIAIVGIGGVFPGASDLESFWENIVAAKDCAREPPAGRWLLPLEDVFAAGGPQADKVYSKRACFVDEFQADLQGLSIAREELDSLDPMCRLLLQAAAQAWRDSVTGPLDRQRVGLVIGNIALPSDSASRLADELLVPVFEKQLGIDSRKPVEVNKLNRFVAGLPAGILARALGLGGGSYTLDAACASSLYSLKYAVDELRSGRRDAMLCGGLSRPDSLYTQMGFSALHAISASGRCSPFDGKGDGLVVGEGAGILVLKRLQDAERDGDDIYATIAGIGLSNDIEGNLMSPDSEGQLRAMRMAYQQAGWQPADVDLIECHGTGTPVGDGVEFNSLVNLWGEQRNDQDCVIGSVKSNIGHLLTAAGSAGLIKVLLAMKQEQLPPTANFESASKAIDLETSPFTVLSQARPWHKRSPTSARRAAISAFGFGGINAHVLLEQWTPNTVARQTPAITTTDNKEETPIAIVGMDACFGPWTDLAAFRQRVLGFDTERRPQTMENDWGVEHHIKGFGIGEVRMPLGRFRIPPRELRELLPQQLLMLQIAANAIEDAGEGLQQNLKTAGVYIGIGLDLSTTNFHLRWNMLPLARTWSKQLGLDLTEEQLQDWVAELRETTWPAMNANRTMGGLGGIVASRIARAFSVGGPSFTLSSEESSGLRALDTAVGALRRGEISAAIVGAVDLASDLRALAGVGSNHLVGEGAAAVVLKREDDARRYGDRVYALVRDVASASGSEAAALAVERALHLAGDEKPPGLVALHGNNPQPASNGHDEAVLQILRRAKNDLPAALADVSAEIGHSGAASGLASLVKSSLCLYHRVLGNDPAAVRTARNLEQSEAFFFPTAAQYWLRNRQNGPRRALVCAHSTDDTALAAILEEADAAGTLAGSYREVLFSLCGDHKYELIDALQRLRALAADEQDLRILAQAWWQRESAHQHKKLAVSVIARSIDELLALLKQVQVKVDAEQEVRSDKVFYSPQPMGDEAGLAFVFPGSGSHFIGMGSEMSARWPEVLERLDAENETLASQYAGSRFWSAADTRDFSHEHFIFGQVWLGTMVSDVISSFSIRPNAVIGYCLGETVGLFATRTWKDRDLMLRRMQATPLFTRDLGGSCDAVKQSWGLASDAQVDWQLGVIDRNAEAVKVALSGRERVYLLIINTPNECVIGGDGEQVQKLVKELGCGFHALEGVTTVHCEVVKAVEQAYRELHLFDTKPPAGVSFYSGIAGKKIELTRESAAESITRQALETFDYTRLINNAWNDGVRIFIEMGPGASCSRMIGQILGERPYIARSACVNGQSDVGNVLRILAQLNSERVALDISSLYQAPTEQDRYAANEKVAVAVGKPAFSIRRPKTPQVIPNTETTGAKAVAEVIDHPASHKQSQSQVQVLSEMIEQMSATEVARAEVEEAFLRVANGINDTLSQAISTQMNLLQSMPANTVTSAPGHNAPASKLLKPAFDRDMCMEFAIGSIARMLGPKFAEVDNFPSRVRLPDEPLMLVDRILEVEGEVASMSNGRVVTEHDVRAGAWYLDAGRIPTCIAVEAGQADLFLSGYLGIDLQTRGLSMYRLLDAEVCFHGPLPQAGEVIHYDIHIEHFFRQGDTWLFRFYFDGSVNGEPLITMRKGCAGFFSQAELDAGRGIVLTTLEKQPLAGKCADDWRPPLAMQNEAFNDFQVNALRQGDLAMCFGDAFAGLPLNKPMGLPGGKMTLVHRILSLEPEGGRFGLGRIIGEADIHEDDWFLTCHFVDDQVMPGTLMYECCLHTLRIYLLRMGWVGEADEFVYEPVPGVTSKLKCRGQVLASTSKVQYQISIKEIGYSGDEQTPYVIADALMSADGKAIVQMGNMSLRLSGLGRARIESLWAGSSAETVPQKSETPTVLFDYASINAFAVGRPSEAFGDRYRVFDEERVIARLPGPPFQFLDRIISITDCEPWQLKAGALIEGQYDVPQDAWYFEADRQCHMPFSVLLEIALQPCGWLAAYLGSALTSEVDLSFRNLGGKAQQLRRVGRHSGTLTIKVKMTNVSLSGGMIIQNYDFEVRDDEGVVYVGDTYFGFFSKAALADQVGIREAEVYEPEAEEQSRALTFSYPQQAPYPDAQMRMVDEIELFDARGGPAGLGFIRGSARVNADAWFFKAHFHQDPVWPGSLGLESFMQLLKVVAVERWGDDADAEFQCMALDQVHSWLYRGQILPGDEKVSVQACISGLDDEQRILRADGFLSVDGRIIYQMTDFALKMQTS